jgi:cold shock CspA family protein
MKINKRLKGKVRIVSSKYGFIRHYPEGQPRVDYFFHGDAVEGIEWFKLEPGDLVSFVLKDNERGPKATEIRLECESHLIKKENG